MIITHRQETMLQMPTGLKKAQSEEIVNIATTQGQG